MKMRLPALAGASADWLRIMAIATVLAFGGSAAICHGGQSNQTDEARSSSSPWRASQVIEPEALVNVLASNTGEKPLVICVGFPVFYHGGHIVGAKFAGPAVKAEGIAALKQEVKDVSPSKQIVLYCGCCSWTDCPNIRPAFRALEQMGFTNVNVLSIPTNFREDWTDKGYPVAKETD